MVDWRKFEGGNGEKKGETSKAFGERRVDGQWLKTPEEVGRAHGFRGGEKVYRLRSEREGGEEYEGEEAHKV